MEEYKKLPEKDYNKLSKQVKEVVTDWFKKHYKELQEGFDLDAQIQDGYLYTISTQTGSGRSFTVMTGTGGCRDYIEAARKACMPDFFIAQDIYINDNGKDIWIGDITWKKIDQE